MLCIIGIWATISKISTFENTGFVIFMLTQQLWYFYPQYVTNGNFKLS